MLRLVIASTLAIAASASLAQSDPAGLTFVSITNPGNPAYQSSDPRDFVNGRGQVNYEYRLARSEVPTSLWCDFFNAAFDRPANDQLPFVTFPGSQFWGAVGTIPNNPGGHRWIVPAGRENIPVGDISWRTAAMFCNWLNAGQSSDRS